MLDLATSVTLFLLANSVSICSSICENGKSMGAELSKNNSTVQFPNSLLPVHLWSEFCYVSCEGPLLNYKACLFSYCRDRVLCEFIGPIDSLCILEKSDHWVQSNEVPIDHVMMNFDNFKLTSAVPPSSPSWVIPSAAACTFFLSLARLASVSSNLNPRPPNPPPPAFTVLPSCNITEWSEIVVQSEQCNRNGDFD